MPVLGRVPEAANDSDNNIEGAYLAMRHTRELRSTSRLATSTSAKLSTTS